MSFEGYYQKLCKNGHQWIEDCYIEHESHLCPECGEETIWHNLVDQTNGSYDNNNNRIDGYIELEIDERTNCPCCGNILETIYKVPGGEK